MKLLMKLMGFIICFILGLLTGYIGKPDIPPVNNIVHIDTTIIDTTFITWEYPDIETVPIITTDTLPSDIVAEQDSVHTIHFEIAQGTGDIEYNIFDRTGELTFRPHPVSKEHTYVFESVNIKETIVPIPEPTYNKLYFIGGCVVGVVSTVGLIAAVGAVL